MAYVVAMPLLNAVNAVQDRLVAHLLGSCLEGKASPPVQGSSSARVPVFESALDNRAGSQSDEADLMLFEMTMEPMVDRQRGLGVDTLLSWQTLQLLTAMVCGRTCHPTSILRLPWTTAWCCSPIATIVDRRQLPPSMKTESLSGGTRC
jgi:hypothetical protein